MELFYFTFLTGAFILECVCVFLGQSLKAYKWMMSLLGEWLVTWCVWWVDVGDGWFQSQEWVTGACDSQSRREREEETGAQRLCQFAVWSKLCNISFYVCLLDNYSEAAVFVCGSGLIVRATFKPWYIYKCVNQCLLNQWRQATSLALSLTSAERHLRAKDS